MIEHQAEIKVRYAETDAQGHAYHGNYFVWLDIARTDMLDALGYPYKRLESEGVRIVVLEATCRYKKPAYFDDVLQIRTTVPELSRTRLTIHYEVTRGADLLATGLTTLGCISEDGKPIRIPEAFATRLSGEGQMN